jgi:hypothetical protein
MILASARKKIDENAYFVICFVARAIAYSATTVFPADVCAATKTESPFSK